MSSHNLSQQPTLARLLTYFSEHKFLLCLAFLSTIIFSAVDAGMVYLIKPLIDNGLAQANGQVLKIGALFVVVIFFIRGIASFVSNYSLAYISSKITYKIREQAFEHLQFLPMSYLQEHSSGQIIAKFTYDAEQVAKAMAETMLVCLRESLIILVLIAIMFYTSWQLSLIFFVIAPAIAFVITRVSRRFKDISKILQDAMGEVTRQCEQSVANHREVLALSTQAQELQRFDTVNNHNRQQTMKLASASAMCNPIVQLIASLAMAIVFYLASVEGIVESLSAGSFTATLVAMGSLLRPLKQLTNINQNLQRGLAAAQSLFQFLDLPKECDRGEQNIEFQHELQLKNVNFCYPQSTQTVLKEVSFTLRKGKKLAIVGESGSGKSSLLNLLLRFYRAEQRPDSFITLDGTELQQISLQNLRKQFSLVSQQIVLFDDSIAANIRYGCETNVSPEQIEAAAKAAHVWDFAQQMAMGLNSPVGENGNLLSGGQKQRIAIARAILKDAPILLLDEATSALDSKSEAQIQRALEQLQKNKTSIVIAHRLSTIRDADQILVMSRGEVVERGQHSQLIANKGNYYQLYLQQILSKEEA
ncbi:lipid A export permease/ATP-binding protein MsbA [Pseudoalteromonas shioyasakiensis]|uniref:lipid A export permease/ATP-binding protein MsbA n=1 Tax=Pseudoalteromonas shioyasakiensis TaxID=1190813 RepID=UPI001C3D4F01|nr:lipid A export permease/ATP-binding protein MsbA [Pseudoalteromonas shioyasakiensis]